MANTGYDKHLENGEIGPPPINERKLLTKIDIHLLPCLCFMYMITFLDRVNIGNAAVLGMRDDLGLKSGMKYNAALMIFFIPYILFEIPSNILLKKLSPHVWLTFCTFGFGLVLTFQGLVQSWSTLMATRFFLGMFEAGMLPGCVYLLGMWYKRSEGQKRYSFFASSVILAGAFGGLLASAIGKMDGMRGYRGWRWVFIVEGCATCFMAIVNFFVIPDFPEDCKWINEREFAFLRGKLAAETGRLTDTAKLGWREILGVFRDWKILVGGFMFFGQAVAVYGYAFFAPTIIHAYGYGEIKTQLYSIPPWAAAYGCSLACACLSDYFRHRYLFTLIPMLVGIAGFGILLSVRDTAHHNLQYAALHLLTSGCFSAGPIFLCWFGMNLGGHRRRMVGTAWQIGFGNVGGIVATYSFLEKDAPLYRNGYIIGLSFSCFSAAMATLYLFGVWRENKMRERIRAQGMVEVTPEDEERLGDLAITYRYAY
ncbi:major facilitator superfamily domain-containing protein [Aspergillus lucknowensis]|uniref:Major facilitator superfamily domain-containing protein n=1 Tax=Aspergillus lucknowensis TaxID=176173 RepID=A0ABR4M4W6_9EURO